MRGILAIHSLDKYLYDMTAYCPASGETEKPEGMTDFTEEYYAWCKPLDDAHRRYLHVFDELRDNIIVEDVHGENSRDRIFVDSRTVEILEYLDRHQEITSFVAIDDRNLNDGIASHFVMTNYKIFEEHYQKCRKILDVEDGPYHIKLKDSYDRKILESWRRDTYGK